MRVDGFAGKVNLVDVAQCESRRDGAGDPAPPSPLHPAVTFQPTGDLQRLLDALRQTPVVRPEVVADVAGRLKAGELNSPNAKEETITAILGSTLSDS